MVVTPPQRHCTAQKNGREEKTGKSEIILVPGFIVPLSERDYKGGQWDFMDFLEIVWQNRGEPPIISENFAYFDKFPPFQEVNLIFSRFFS